MDLVDKPYNVILGDCLEVLKTLPNDSVQCCVTSPPYYRLKDYGTDVQIGLENTPEMYIYRLVQVFREVRRVLKPDGTLWLNLGDSYADRDNGKDVDVLLGENKEKYQNLLNNTFDVDIGTHFGKIKYKDLIGIPWMAAFSLRADGWYLRQDIIWSKANTTPEGVKDRCTKSHEYIFLMTKSENYYFDYESIREPAVYKDETGKRSKLDENGVNVRKKRSVWHVSAKKHYDIHPASYSEDLITPCILAGSREGDIVLDPFNGSGTTGAAALRHKRKYIGIEINEQYYEISNKRLDKLYDEVSIFLF